MEDKYSLKNNATATIAIEQHMGNQNAFYPFNQSPATRASSRLSAPETRHRVFVRVLAFSCSVPLFFSAGCATSGSRQSPQPTPIETTAAAPGKPAVAEDSTLKTSAAAPVASFEGEGWQDMFDGQSLAGWHETKFSGHGEVE